MTNTESIDDAALNDCPSVRGFAVFLSRFLLDFLMTEKRNVLRSIYLG